MIARAERFTKIKYDPKKERVSLAYHVPNGTEEPDEYSMTVRHPPHPDLVAALAALGEDVLDLCELDGVDAESLEVRSVSLSYPQEVMGASITALRALKRSAAPLVLNTPFKMVEALSEGADEDQLLPSCTVRALDRLIDEARRFLDGKRGERAQVDLLPGEGGRTQPRAGRSRSSGMSVTITPESGARMVETINRFLAGESPEAEAAALAMVHGGQPWVPIRVGDEPPVYRVLHRVTRERREVDVAAIPHGELIPNTEDEAQRAEMEAAAYALHLSRVDPEGTGGGGAPAAYEGDRFVVEGERFPRLVVRDRATGVCYGGAHFDGPHFRAGEARLVAEAWNEGRELVLEGRAPMPVPALETEAAPA